jgi:hypothetical protein
VFGQVAELQRVNPDQRIGLQKGPFGHHDHVAGALKQLEGVQHGRVAKNLLRNDHRVVAQVLGQGIGEVELGQSVNEPVVPVREIPAAQKNGLLDVHLVPAAPIDQHPLTRIPHHAVFPVAQTPRPLGSTRLNHELVTVEEKTAKTIIRHARARPPRPGHRREHFWFGGDQILPEGLRPGHHSRGGGKKLARFF